MADSGNLMKEPVTNGNDGAASTIAAGLSYQVNGVVVDAAGDLFVSDTGNNVVKEIPYSAGVNGAVITIATGFSSPGGISIDASGNLYVADTSNNAVKQIPFSNGTYGSPLVLGTGFNAPQATAVDSNGRVYVDDINTVQQVSPAP